jgi:hypothetical protein
MGEMASAKDELIRAADLAAAGAEEEAHAIAQRHEGDPVADWLHAVLHKIGGDAGNSRYWYRRTAHTFENLPTRSRARRRHPRRSGR